MPKKGKSELWARKGNKIAQGRELKGQQDSRPKKEKVRKVSFGPKKKIKQLKAKSLGLNKAQGLKKRKK